MKASLAQKTKKLFGGFFSLKTFLTTLIFVLSFNSEIAKAQITGPIPAANVNFDEFACLFTKTDANGKCTHNPDDANVKTGAESGVVYGKTNTFTDKGVTSITMQIGLWLDVAKEVKEGKYHYSRVADNKSDTFLLRLKYEPVTGYPLYKLIDIPYQKDNVEIKDITGYRSVSVDLTKGSPQLGVAFYKVAGTGGVATPNGPETITQQVVNAIVDTQLNSGTTVEIPFGSTISADLWYCGGERKASRPLPAEVAAGLVNPVDGRRAPKNDPLRPDLAGRVEYFTSDGKYRDKLGEHTDGIPYGSTKCDGTAYFKIGKTIDFKLPESKEAAQADSQKELFSGIVNSEYLGSVLPLCSIDPFTNGSVMGCVAQILYGGVFRPVAFFAQLMGNIFDFFLGYSLSDESYRHDFVQTGWQLVRDISNIFFIIIMIWSGLVAIFDTKKSSYKTVIPTLIINALIINFSLFATRIVIDLSNITARIFYNQMVVKVDGEIAPSESGFKPISEAIVSSFNPQSIFRNSVLQSENANPEDKNAENEGVSFNGQSNTLQENGGFKRYSKEYASYFALVTLIAIMISFSVAVMFWKTAFIFIGRVVGLYIAMIFSPFAFLSRGKLPLVGSIPGINFSSWWKDLSQYALLAPIFVFFLYIINAFLNVEFFTKVGLDQNVQGASGSAMGFFSSVMYVLIPMLIIYGLVTKGVDVAKRFSGTLGEQFQKFGNIGGGIVGGVLAGGTALAGRKVIGATAARLDNSRFGLGVRNMAAQKGITGWVGKNLQRGLNASRSGSFDIRSTPVGAQVSSGLGVNLNEKSLKVLSTLGLDSEKTKGGFDAQIKREEKSLEEKESLLKEKMTESQLADYNKTLEAKRQAKIDKIAIKDMVSEFGKEAVKNWKKNNPEEFESKKKAALEKDPVKELVKKVPEAKTFKSPKEATNARRKEFGENLKTPSVFSSFAEQIAKQKLSESLRKELEENEKDRKAKELKEKAEKQLEKANSELEGINKKIQELIDNNPNLVSKKPDGTSKNVDELDESERNLLAQEVKKGNRDLVNKKRLLEQELKLMESDYQNLREPKDKKDRKAYENKKNELIAKITNKQNEINKKSEEIEDSDTTNIWDKRENAESKVNNLQDVVDKRVATLNALNEAKGNRKKEDKAEEKK